MKFRYRLGNESLCREVTGIRSPGGGSAGSRGRCGAASDDVDEAEHPVRERGGAGLNEALLAKAAEAKVLRTNRVRADTTVVPANVSCRSRGGAERARACCRGFGDAGRRFRWWASHWSSSVLRCGCSGTYRSVCSLPTGIRSQ